jgi:hypothetical protein
LAEQGINVLWGSFEIKNSRLIKKLLQQFAREPIDVQDCKKLDAIADRFEQLPLHFMKFHGGTDVDDVLDAMDYAGEHYTTIWRTQQQLPTLSFYSPRCVSVSCLFYF